MITTLSDTTSAQISTALLNARRNAGGAASGMVLTLIIVADPSGYPAALDAAMSAGREHPCRILLMVTGNARQTAGLDAEVRIGEDTPGEVVVVRMRGPLARYPASVLRPLLLPDSPVVVWWPDSAPQNQTADSLAELSDRRITDAASGRQPRRELGRRAERLVPGDVDLAWTRLTGWRTLLAAALDQFPAKVTKATVESERGNASADLLAAWLGHQLQRPVRHVSSEGPGITAARLTTPAGDIAITRTDGRLASYSVPGQPNRLVALKRRTAADLIAEELRRMDRDTVYEQVLATLQRRGSTARKSPANSTASGNGRRRTSSSASASARTATAKKATGTKTTGTKAAGKKAAGTNTSTAKRAAKKSSATAPRKQAAAKKSASSSPSTSSGRG